MTVDSDRTFRIDADLTAVWRAFERIDRYPQWWPWLRRFEPDGGLVPGASWRCVIAPPVLYRLHLVIALAEVDDRSRIEATIDGDLCGTAMVETTPVDDRTTNLRVRSTLAPRRGIVRVVSALVPPVARHGHDWVIETGVRQFAERAV